jgi:hypothetical protein
MISADYDTLMRQAPMTVQGYLLAAIKYIDGALGKGYAHAHPELLAACVSASAADFHTSMVCKTQEATATTDD